MSLIVGVDVGGSHVSSALVDNKNFKIIPNTYCSGVVDNKASKEIIFSKWAEVINQTIQQCDHKSAVEIAFSMPGPFDYETGLALFEGNDKFEALYNASIPEEFAKYIHAQKVSFRFLNDATSFGIGSILMHNLQKTNKKVISITLGTGFGAAFFDDLVPVTSGENVPEDGCLWDKPFQDGIADEYFSTRWFINKYEEYSGKKITDGVKEISNCNDEFASKVFNEFAVNLSTFLQPFINNFETTTLILGGNIAKCHELFLPKVLDIWKEKKNDIEVVIFDNTEKSSIIGTTYMFKK